MGFLKYLTISIIMISSLAAGSISIEPYTFVKHYNKTNKNNNVKYIGLVYEIDGFGIGAATFTNSHYTRTNAIFGQYIYKKNIISDDLYIGAYVLGGYRTGYKTKMMVYGGPYVEYKNLYIKINVNPKFYGFTLGYRW